MATSIVYKTGLLEARPDPSSTPGTLYYATDTKQWSLSSGKGWAVPTFYMEGAASARPSGGFAPGVGTFYFASDTLAVSLFTSGGWVTL